MRWYICSLSIILIIGFKKPGFTAPTFVEDIAPIIYQNCIQCHHEGGIAPFSLMTYEEVSKRSRQITEVVESGFMPPWMPDSELTPALIGERFLSKEEIELLRNWHEESAPEGSSATPLTPPSITDEWQGGSPDLILEFPEPYILQEEGIDVYRNFVIPISVDEKRYVRRLELIPNTKLAIHHALITIDTTKRSRLQDSLDAGPGYEGMGIGSAEFPSGHFIGWTPGQVPYESYPGTSWAIEPDSDLVIQLHMLPTGKPEVISPQIGLYFSDEPPTQLSMTLQMRDFDIDIPAGEQNYWIKESMKIPVDVRAVGIYPHAHYLAKEMNIFVTMPDGNEKTLIYIPEWDFNWQSDYRYIEPITLPAGSQLNMHYRYDNSDENVFNPNYPAKRVVGGWKSTDEMGEVVVQVLVDSDQDLQLLQQSQIDYDMEAAGGDANYNYNIGIYLEQQGELQRALSFYLKATELDESFASAYYNVADIYRKLGDLHFALKYFNEALAVRQDFGMAEFEIAKIEFELGKTQGSVARLKSLIERYPDDLNIHLALARVLRHQDLISDAYALLMNKEIVFDKSAEFQIELAQIEIEKSIYQSAENRLNSILETNDSDKSTPGYLDITETLKAAALSELAQIFHSRDNLNEALNYIDGALEREPLQSSLYIRRLAILRSLEDTAEFSHTLIQLVSLSAQLGMHYQSILEELDSLEEKQTLASAYAQINDFEWAFKTADEIIKSGIYSEEALQPLKLKRREYLLESL